MAVATAFQFIGAQNKVRGIIQEGTSDAAFTGWEDMQGFKYFGVLATVASSTGAIGSFTIHSAASSTGLSNIEVKSSSTTTANAISDYLWLELDATEISSTDVDGRWVSAYIQGTTNTHFAVTYIKGGGPAFLNQTAEYIST